MKYGLNYQGSKSGFVEELCDIFPAKRNFYDLFAGGGSVTHRMLVLGYFQRYFMCDINPLPITLFEQCAKGNAPSPRWVSREEFNETKNTDAYAACCFCFGGDWSSYAYAKEIEPIKKAMHYAIVDLDYSYADALGLDLHFLSKYNDWHQRRLAIRQEVKRADRLDEIQHLERHVSLEYMEALVGLQILSELDSTKSFEVICKPYDEVTILPDSVIYCDPPYRNTKKYVAGQFDHEKFYDWCRNQTELVFISEYSMPDDFICIKEFSRADKKSAYSLKHVIERVFIPRHQEEQYNENKNTIF